MAIPFMKAETEETATQKLAFIAIVAVTVGLAVFNVTGAIVGSSGTSFLQLLARTAFAILLTGAELLAAVALVRVMLAPNRLRKVVGLLVFFGLAWVCIQNGKRTAHFIFPDFEQSSALLNARANIAEEEEDLQREARLNAINATPVELEKVRTQIAELQTEQRLMASQSPEKIKEAQSLLIAQGKYFGRVDGVRAELTEAAMRARGEELASELETLKLREEGLAAGVVTAGISAAQVGADGNPILSPAERRAELEDKARKAARASLWIEIMLWVMEGARSLGLWVYVTTITTKTANIVREQDVAEPVPNEQQSDLPENLGVTDATSVSADDLRAADNDQNFGPDSGLDEGAETFIPLEPEAVEPKTGAAQAGRLGGLAKASNQRNRNKVSKLPLDDMTGGEEAA